MTLEWEVGVKKTLGNDNVNELNDETAKCFFSLAQTTAIITISYYYGCCIHRPSHIENFSFSFHKKNIISISIDSMRLSSSTDTK